MFLKQKEEVIYIWSTDISKLSKVEELADIDLLNHPFLIYENRIISTIYYLLNYKDEQYSYDLLSKLNFHQVQRLNFGEVITTLYYIIHYDLNEYFDNINKISKLTLNNFKTLVKDYPTRFIYKLTGMRIPLNNLSIKEENLEEFKKTCLLPKSDVASIYSNWINSHLINHKNISTMDKIGSPYHRVTKILSEAELKTSDINSSQPLD